MCAIGIFLAKEIADLVGIMKEGCPVMRRRCREFLEGDLEKYSLRKTQEKVA
jgi:hypothetical protein